MGPSASGFPQPLLTEFRMSEILGAGVEQTDVNTRQTNIQGDNRIDRMGEEGSLLLPKGIWDPASYLVPGSAARSLQG